MHRRRRRHRVSRYAATALLHSLTTAVITAAVPRITARRRAAAAARLEAVGDVAPGKLVHEIPQPGRDRALNLLLAIGVVQHLLDDLRAGIHRRDGIFRTQ